MSIDSHIGQATNDKLEIAPTLASLQELHKMLDTFDALLTDASYYSDGNTACCEQTGNELYIPPHRVKNNQPFTERFNNLAPLSESATPTELIRKKPKTAVGRTISKQRKSTVEAVFSIIQQVLGLRQFSFAAW